MTSTQRYSLGIEGDRGRIPVGPEYVAATDYDDAITTRDKLAERCREQEGRIQVLEGRVRDLVPRVGRMVGIEELIEELKGINEKFGNTCVYIRDMPWGAKALWAQDIDTKALAALAPDGEGKKVVNDG